jgi:hypothetical protein
MNKKMSISPISVEPHHSDALLIGHSKMSNRKTQVTVSVGCGLGEQPYTEPGSSIGQSDKTPIGGCLVFCPIDHSQQALCGTEEDLKTTLETDPLSVGQCM